MIYLDEAKRWILLFQRNASIYLNKDEYEEYRKLSETEMESGLKALLERPIASFTVLNELYFRARWDEALGAVYYGDDLTLLEVATGDADMIPQMLGRTRPHSHYITSNMNKLLNHSLLKKTKGLPITMRLIDDDAANITSHIGEASVDVITFQHAVNDVLQAILCGREGIDTIDSDWMETLPEMIAVLQREVRENTLEQHIKGAFLELIRSLLKVLKPGGIIIMNHYMFQLDLDWGYPPELFENMLPMVREWLRELDAREIFVEGFHPNWWLFLKKP
ncbi:hypothetical protein HNQ56_004686 [Anaerotaenia torta]|uniref:hypothetical protein n=1 Tax=Anaerotaenia torta TaxID=433293 RepID=UPI003D2069CE